MIAGARTSLDIWIFHLLLSNMSFFSLMKLHFTNYIDSLLFIIIYAVEPEHFERVGVVTRDESAKSD